MCMHSQTCHFCISSDCNFHLFDKRRRHWNHSHGRIWKLSQSCYGLQEAWQQLHTRHYCQTLKSFKKTGSVANTHWRKHIWLRAGVHSPLHSPCSFYLVSLLACKLQYHSLHCWVISVLFMLPITASQSLFDFFTLPQSDSACVTTEHSKASVHSLNIQGLDFGFPLFILISLLNEVFFCTHSAYSPN